MIFLQNTNLRYIKGWLFSCLFFLLTGCGNSSNKNVLVVAKEDSLRQLKKTERAFIQIHSAKQIITTGDLIVRTGNDFTSESLRNLNQRDKTYSHCGIASIENDSVFVYHALGGDFNPDQKIRKDKFEVFAEPYSNRGIGITATSFYKAKSTI
jgi:hypothetical protein